MADMVTAKWEVLTSTLSPKFLRFSTLQQFDKKVKRGRTRKIFFKFIFNSDTSRSVTCAKAILQTSKCLLNILLPPLPPPAPSSFLSQMMRGTPNALDSKQKVKD